MARIRSNNVFGTTTNNPLLVGGVTLNSAGLANLGVVATPNLAYIILDPNRVNGAPEIVEVTAHTGAATSATIVRATFGTTAREHPLGTEWVHGPVAEFSPTGSRGGDFGGFWQSWTPTFVNFTLGNGTFVAAFARDGDNVQFYARVVLGSSSSMGTDPTMSLPVASHADYVNESSWLGHTVVQEPGVADYMGLARKVSASVVRLMVSNASGTYLTQSGYTATEPAAWAPADVFFVFGTYRSA